MQQIPQIFWTNVQVLAMKQLIRRTAACKLVVVGLGESAAAALMSLVKCFGWVWYYIPCIFLTM